MGKEMIKIIANKQQLEDIGIDYDLTGLSGWVRMTYGDGWLLVSVTHSIGRYTFTNDFDLPPSFTEKT